MQDLFITCCQAPSTEQAILEVLAPEAQVKCSFQVQHKAEFGQQVAIVGSSSHLGKWQPADAMLLTWTEGHVWVGETTVTQDEQLEFKVSRMLNAVDIPWINMHMQTCM